jgi:hypothetical protein
LRSPRRAARFASGAHCGRQEAGDAFHADEALQRADRAMVHGDVRLVTERLRIGRGRIARRCDRCARGREIGRSPRVTGRATQRVAQQRDRHREIAALGELAPERAQRVGIFGIGRRVQRVAAGPRISARSAAAIASAAARR